MKYGFGSRTRRYTTTASGTPNGASMNTASGHGTDIWSVSEEILLTVPVSA